MIGSNVNRRIGSDDKNNMCIFPPLGPLYPLCPFGGKMNFF